MEWEQERSCTRITAEERWDECVRVLRECVYPKPVEDVGQVRLAIMQWEEKWKAMMSELGGDAKIPDLWRMSALLRREETDADEVG